MKKYIISLALVITMSELQSQTITWANEIGSLVYKNCTSCHHTGGVAPFSMMTYQQVFNNRFKIRGAVSNKNMPPWPPDNKYRLHAFSRALSASDIEKFEKWIDGGAVSGDLNKAPIAPVYDNLGEIKNPDLTITTPKYTINSLYDEYRCFPDSTRLTKDMWMTALECIPSDPQVVHHVLIFRDKGTKSYSLDSKQDGPGYVCFGGSGTNDADLLAAWVPGSGAFKLPKGFGMKIPAKSNIIVQVHYPAGARGKSDQTKVKFKLTDQPQRETYLLPALNHEISLTNGPLVIPANTVKTFNEKFYLPIATISLIGVAPHMHLLGKSIKTWAVSNDSKEIPLINIPNWDFHWQGVYQFPKIQKIPAGSTLYSEAIYDNTATNPHNPNNPPKEVREGEATTDEMMITYFLFAQYLPGDENFIIDTTAANLSTAIKNPIHLNKTISISPNPSLLNKNAYLDFVPNNNDKVHLQVYDMQGRSIFSSTKIYNSSTSESIQLPSHIMQRGVYIIKLQGNDWIATEKWLIE